MIPQLKTRGSRASEARLEHFQRLPTHPDVVMLGDSLTQAIEWSESFPELSIVNRGINGDTSAGVLLRLSETEARRPGTVFVMIGINDLLQGVSEQAVADNCRQILQRLRSSGIKVCIQSVLLPGQGLEPLGERVKVLNGLLSQLAEQSGSSYLDHNPALAPEGFLRADLTYDGIHLNGEGCDLLVKSVAEHL
jgi:lysophospholipase L1-like esterase